MNKFSRALWHGKALLVILLAAVLLVTSGVHGALMQLRCASDGFGLLLADTDASFSSSGDIRAVARKASGLFRVSVDYFKYSVGEEYIRGIENYTVTDYLLSQAHNKDAELIIVGEAHRAELLEAPFTVPLEIDIPAQYLDICCRDGVAVAFPLTGCPVTAGGDFLSDHGAPAFAFLLAGSDHPEAARAYLSYLNSVREAT